MSLAGRLLFQKGSFWDFTHLICEFYAYIMIVYMVKDWRLELLFPLLIAYLDKSAQSSLLPLLLL